ncbi:hypothetical protein ACHAXR_012546 [Thalassiosira sp. AJA248-18]
MSPQRIDGGGGGVTDDNTAPTPPIPFRDETSFLLAGEELLPSTTSKTEDDTTITSPLLRQSISSPHPLLSPPRQIPNPYGWMRDESRTNTTVLDHLHAENEYGQQVTAHLDGLREDLYQEFLDTIQQTDYTTPALKPSVEGGTSYWYYARFEEGESYPRYCRAPQISADDLYPPPVNEEWDQKIMNNSNNETSFPPLLPNEEVYLDVPAMARNKTYLAVGTIAISPNNKYVAYSLDEKGGETCQLYVKHFETGKEWVLRSYGSGSNATDEGPEPLECDGGVIWNDESNALFFVTMDDTHRPYKLYRRQVFDSDGQWIDVENQEEDDELLLEESDELFTLLVSKTFDGKYLIARSLSKESSEVHYLDLRPSVGDEKDKTETASNKLVCIAKRQPKVLYRVTHCQGYWLVQTNMGGLPNLSLKACHVGEEGMSNWKDVVSSETDTPVFDGGHERSLDGVTIFNPATDDESPSPLAYAAVYGREEGMPRVWVLELNEAESATAKDLTVSRLTRLEFDETAYDVGLGSNRDPSLPYVVISYDSLVTPPSHIAIPLSNPVNLDARRVLKEKEVPGYDKESYACERTMVMSRDGKTEIPVSLVYHRDVLLERGNGAIPTHLYGYGSYGASIEASFRATRLPLLKRKVVYALAHVRGGGENGRPWYDEAKYLTKKNTFNDFVDIARWLVGDEAGDDSSADGPSIGKGITTPNKLSCEGRSAGGLLIGASLNQQPELFSAAIFGVPFVDVCATMIDASIPLTVAEWEEWGNPNEERYFDYMMSYCPMQNVQNGAVYPSCLITGGLHDPRVQASAFFEFNKFDVHYWEPAKFASELRHRASSESGPVVLKMDMDSGHFSASDRYKYLRELAFEYAFLLDTLGHS